jgi:hypothetical protein
MQERFIFAQGDELAAQHHRRACTPASKGVATAPPRSHSMLRVAGSLAVGCGVSRRPRALLCAALFLLPLTQSSRKRWMDAMGSTVPSQEEMVPPWLALPPSPACHLDGDAPRGTAHGVRVGKEAPARLRMPPEAGAEPGAAARQLLQTWHDLGLHGTAACAEASPRFPAAIQAVSPQARWPADHGHTGKPSWGPLKKARCASRRPSQARGEAKNEPDGVARAQRLWQWRGSRRKPPSNGSAAAKQAMAELERAEEGLVHRCRSLVRQRVHLFDHAPSAAPAQLRRPQRRRDIRAGDEAHLEKMLPFCADHWAHAWRYLWKKGMGKHRRGSNAESGRRRRRRLEKNHDGLRSAAPRQHYIHSSAVQVSSQRAVSLSAYVTFEKILHFSARKGNDYTSVNNPYCILVALMKS